MPNGVDPDNTAYRLIESPIRSISDTASMPHPRWTPGSIVEALDAGIVFPPIVVFRHMTGGGWGLLDGVNRTHTYSIGRSGTAQAYELIEQ